MSVEHDDEPLSSHWRVYHARNGFLVEFYDGDRLDIRLVFADVDEMFSELKDIYDRVKADGAE